MDDNSRPHRTLAVEELLGSEDITRMDWPAYSSDLDPIEHVWDALRRCIAARLHHPENTQQLKQMLIEEWVLLPQEMLHQMVLSMWRRDEAHFWLNGYVNKQSCRIWSEANPQVYVETPLHPEKLTVWCALWAGGILLQKR
ncbi:transposable element Tcb2 transposase [Trichonephila clavipes]|uniref:Transposable element Tcb2 transposase n=1 Tax=Trichonephila clavipes TaxID=2585209 RepID=A0A8X7BIH9_TRICX|nr:transposable element Tcb2 transposase [Trichonephila clavipes]